MKVYNLKGIWFLLIPLAIVIFLAGCGKNGYGSDNSTNPPPPGNTPPNTVVIANFAFSPSSITVSVGDTVTWRNDDNVGHTVTSDSGSELASTLLGSGQTYRHVFMTAGTYPYHCTVHTSMRGTVIVQ